MSILKHATEQTQPCSIPLAALSVTKIFTHSFVLLSLIGCASQADQKLTELRGEATAFCEVHNPDNWTDETSSDDYEHLVNLSREIKKVVKSDEFLQIFKDQGTLSPELYAEKYGNDYVYFKSKISDMLGENWDCEYLKYHYVVGFESSFSSLTG